MKPQRILMFLLAATLAACSKTPQPSAQNTRSGDSAISMNTTAVRPPEPGITIPKDARWTIFCQAIGGDNHISDAKALRDYLLRTTRLRDWYIIHSDKESTLYYGFYKSIDERSESKEDRAEAARKQADLRAVAAIMNPATGTTLFRGVFVAPIEGPDPNAPAEWNLANAKGDAYYTLQVGVYKDSPDRKRAAVEAVREARKSGIPAYYYHGPTASSVCVGLWPKTAVELITKSTRPHTDPNDLDKPFTQPGAVMALPGGTEIPQALANRDDIEVVQDKLQVLDKSLEEMAKKYPWHAINGVEVRTMIDPRTGQLKHIRTPSVLVVVPNARDRAADHPSLAMPQPILPPTANPSLAEQPPADPFKSPAPRVPASKGGRLKSIGE